MRQLYLALLESPHHSLSVFPLGGFSHLSFSSASSMLRGNIPGNLTTLGGERLLSAQNHILNLLRIEFTEVLRAPPPACWHSFRRVPPSQIRERPVSWVQRQFLSLTMIAHWGKCVGNALWLQLWDSRSEQSPYPIPLSTEGPLKFTMLWGFQVLICKSI